MVPSAVSLFSSGVPCQRALLAYLARSERITVIMYRPPASKNAMPVGVVPYRSTLLPSPFFCSHETSVHVPTSCSFRDCCWPTALSASEGSANITVAHAAKVLRKSIEILPDGHAITGPNPVGPSTVENATTLPRTPRSQKPTATR